MPDFKKALNAKLELKASNDTSGQIEGMGSMFGEEDSYGDIIEKGAFTETLKTGRKVKMLWQHDTRRVIGVWDKFEETSEGLFAQGRISTEITDGKDALAAVRMGAVDGLSIGFNIPKGAAEWDEEKDVRIIRAIDLWELSIVTFPAAANALISGVKSQEEIDELDLKGLERFLREAGLSRDVAKWLMHRTAKLSCEREAQEKREAQEAALIAEIRAMLAK